MNSKRYDGIDHPVREVKDLREIINSSCEMFPDVDAYLYKDKAQGKFVGIKYSQVKKDVDALGTRLCDMGLKDKKIAVIGETSYYWFLTYYATVCGTGVIVPLDKNLPPEEVKNLIKRSKASAIVYSKKMEKSVKDLFADPGDIEFFISMSEDHHKGLAADQNPDNDGGPSGAKANRIMSLKALITEGADLVHQRNREFLDAEINPDQMATLIFTSGTTGQAKGVMLSHKNIASNVVNMSRRERLGDNFVILSILPTHHTFENTCVDWTTFYQGKTLAICEGIKYISKNMNEVHANCMVGVPLVFEKIYKGMMKQAESTGQGEKLRNAIELSKRLKLYNNPAIMKRMFKTIHEALGGEMQQFIAGGAAIDPQVIRDFEAMGIPMMQGYGMTECSPIIAVNQNNYSIAESVGRPMHGTQVKIDNPGPDGIGEIVCKSPSVMLGYYEDPEATAEVIRDGWLYTGDLGYMDENGFLYVTGRKKTVIVTKGGKNIFPEEIEEVLKEHDVIKEVLVHGVMDKRIGNVALTADIQPNFALLKETYGEMDSSQVYHFFKELVDKVNDTMPAYKAIKRVNIRETDFEMTTTGKIKRYGNFIEGAESSGSPTYTESKKEEKRQAEEFIANIKASDKAPYRYRDGKAITDLKALYQISGDLYNSQPVFKFAEEKARGEDHITYGKFVSDINGLGTALINKGAKGKRFTIKGLPDYNAVVSLFAVTAGVGSVTWERGEEASKLFLAEADAADAANPAAEPAAASETDAMDVAALIEEGNAQLGQGDRQFVDAEVLGEEPAVTIEGITFSHTDITEAVMAASAMFVRDQDSRTYSFLPEEPAKELVLGTLIPIYMGATVLESRGRAYATEDLERLKPTVLVIAAEMLDALYGALTEHAEDSGKGRLTDIWRVANRGTKKVRLNLGRLFGRDTLNLLGGAMKAIVLMGKAKPEVSKYFRDYGIDAIEGYGIPEYAGPIAVLTGGSKEGRKAIKDGSIGFAVPGVEVKIVDRDLDNVGEICLASNGMANGVQSEDGWIHTGDLGIQDEAGYLYIVGKVTDRFGHRQ